MAVRNPGGSGSALIPNSVTWTALTLQNSCVNVGSPFENAAYAVFGPLVLLRGVIAAGGGGLAGNTAMFTLPAGTRPAGYRRFNPQSSAVSSVYNLLPDGTFAPNSGITAGAFVSLDGIVIVLP